MLKCLPQACLSKHQPMHAHLSLIQKVTYFRRWQISKVGGGVNCDFFHHVMTLKKINTLHPFVNSSSSHWVIFTLKFKKYILACLEIRGRLNKGRETKNPTIVTKTYGCKQAELYPQARSQSLMFGGAHTCNRSR